MNDLKKDYVKKERYSIRCAVFLILSKFEDGKEYVLLQRRFHTGIQDGKYDVACSGHLEKKESLKEAMIRETKEELGIAINPDNLSYVSTMHADFKESEYLLVTFWANVYDGEPKIMERDKCSEFKWFPIHELPEDMIDTRKRMIEDYLHKNYYSEYGFHAL